MTVVKGLDEILTACRPREEQHPTNKQLDFVLNNIGEDELDRVLMTNMTRGQVTELIGKWIDRQPKVGRPRRNSRYIEAETAHYGRNIKCYYGNDDLFAETNHAGMFYDYDYETGEWDD